MNSHQHNFKLARLLAVILLTALLAGCAQPSEEGGTPPAPANALMITGPSDGATLPVNKIMVTGFLAEDASALSYSLNGGASEAVEVNDGEYAFWLTELGNGSNTVALAATWLNGQTSTEKLTFLIDIDPSDPNDTDDTDPGDAEAAFYVSNNGSSNAGDVDVFNDDFELLSTFSAGNNEGLELDTNGNLYQAGDTDNGSSIRVISNVAGRPNGSFDADTDREIIGDQTGLKAPKGIALAEDKGYIIVADFGEDASSENLKVFDINASGNVAPVATTDLTVKPWDVAYDASADRLFVALTDGTVAVFDNYTSDPSVSSPDRSFAPVDRRGEQVSDNLHGIAYSANMDSLVVSDVGAATKSSQPGFNEDGGVYVINNASSANGAVRAARSLFGPATGLGNPVDLILVGTEARIAEKANDSLIVYDNVFFGDSGDVGPDLIVDEVKPESLVAARASSQPDPAPDFEADAELSIYLSNNGPDNVGDVDVMDELFNQSSTFDSGNNEGLVLDSAGTLYHAGDVVAGEGSIKIIDDIMNRAGAFDASRDREIKGANTGLAAPKGIEIAKSYIVVADFGAKNIKTFNTSDSGDVAPLATATVNFDEFTPSVWDVTYDAERDNLYAALTNGKVALYRNFTSSFGAGGPDTIIYPINSDNKEIASNLHGIAYVADQDALVLSDVGAATKSDQAGFDTDGQLFVFKNISSTSKDVGVWAIPDVRINGSATLLGNPVDLIVNGDEVRVAEKAQDKLLVFADIFDSKGGNVAPDLAVDEAKPESLVAMAAGGPKPELEANLYVATNGTDNAGNVEALDGDFALLSTFFSGNNEGLELAAGVLYHAGDTTPGEGSIRIIADIEGRAGAFDASRDREIKGDKTGLAAPKGIGLVGNYIVVADFGAKNIKTFNASDSGNVAPVATAPVARGSETPSVWDVAYDAANDVLYAALTDGRVGVYRDFTDDFGAYGLDTIIVPVNDKSNQIGANLHGIAYVAEQDALVVSDVGAATRGDQAGFDTDGSLYVFNGVSSVAKDESVWLEPSVWIEGANTLLGNPVDLIVTDGDVIIAEKAGDKLLTFDDIFDSKGGNVAPDMMIDKVKPESLVPAN